MLVILLTSGKGHYIVSILEAENTRINGSKNSGISTSSQEESAYLGSVHGIYDRNGKELLTPKYTRIDVVAKVSKFRKFRWEYDIALAVL